MNFLKSIAVISSGTFLSRIFGFIRDIFFAKYLGTGFFSDVFLTAYRLPNFFRNLFAEGAFQHAFIPLFAGSVAEGNEDSMKDFANNILSILIYFLLVIVILAEIFMPFLLRIIAPGYVNDLTKFGLAIKLSKITFPYLIIISIISLLSGILNSLNKFAAVSITPIILNVVFISGSILSSFITSLNITYILSYCVLIGGTIQLLWLLYNTYKEGVILFPTFPKLDNKTNEFLRNFGGSFVGSGVNQMNVMIDSIMATMIPGAVSYIYYGDRISQLPLALIGTAISTSILPLLSKQIKLKQKRDINRTQELAILVALFLGIPASIGLFTLSNYIIPILFERGAFTASDSVAVASILKIYAISIPLMILTKILQSIFYANKDTKTPMYLSTISLFSNVILNLILMKFLSYRGIALSTTLTAFLNVGLLFFFLRKDKKIKLSKFFLVDVAKIVYISIIMATVILMCNKFLKNGVTLLSKICKLGATIFLAGLVYLFFAYIVGLLSGKVLKKFVLEK